MSRVAKQPVPVPSGLDVKIQDATIIMKGAKGQDILTVHPLVQVNLDDNELTFSVKDDSKAAKALSGTMRSLASNIVTGVMQGFERKLTLVGVGYRAQLQGNKLNLTLGLSHPVNHLIPEGLTVETPSATEIIIKGVSKQRVGQLAAIIRSYRPPEPYKGKGIRYSDEVIILKETKKK